MKILKSILKKIFIRNNQKIQNRQIYYVTDNGNWSFFWDAYYISKGLKKFGKEVIVTTDPWHLKNQIIHFGDRYAFLFNADENLDSTNTIILTWFHGDSEDQDPNIQHLFNCLKKKKESVDKFLVTCSISKQILIEQNIPEKKIEVIPLGIDLKNFFPVSASQRQNIRKKLDIPKNAICIGSFQKDGAGWEDGNQPKLVKGPDIFLDTIKEVFFHYPEIFILLTGPARGFVKKGLEQIGVPYIHHYLKNYQEINDYYRALDIYLITSRSEGGPKALLEAWASGVAVISTNMGMPADLIINEVNGLLSPVDDVKDLAHNIQKIIQNPELKQKCSNGGLISVQNYSWENISQQYWSKIYQLFT